MVKAQKIRKIGMMSSDTGLIHFDDVRVPQRYRIGEEGLGFTYQMQQFQEERLWAAASTVQGLTRTIQDTIEYVRRHLLAEAANREGATGDQLTPSVLRTGGLTRCNPIRSPG